MLDEVSKMNTTLQNQPGKETYLTLAEVLFRHSVKGSTFSFVSPSVADNQLLLEQVVEHYSRLDMSVETVQEIMFPSMTVVENIFLETIDAWGLKKRRQIEKCRELLEKYNAGFSPSSCYRDLTREEQHIIFLLRVVVHDPQVVVLNNTTSDMSFSLYHVFSEIIRDLVGKGAIVLLLTTKWEEVLKFSSDAAVRVEKGYYSVFPIREIEQNPKKILYTLAGGHKNDIAARNSGSYYALLKGSELFIENQELDETIRHISELVKSTLGAECCDVYFEGDDEQIFTYYGDTANREYQLKELTVKEFLHDNKDLLFLSKRIDDLDEVYVSRPEQCRVLLVVPVFVVPKRVGMMAISFSYYFAYDSEQLLFLRTCCHEIAQIIQTHKIINHSILLQESYHRIKNNLQMVVSLLSLTKLRMFRNDDEKSLELENVLDNVIKQIKSIAFVHEMMSVDTGGEVVNLNYIADKIIGLYATDKISIRKDVSNFRMSSKMATSVSMLINELLCNSCQHAFEGEMEEKAQILLSLHVYDDRSVVLQVSDNGTGMKDPGRFFESRSTGATIIRSLVRELRADFQIEADHGTNVRITFDLERNRPLNGLAL